MSRVLYFLKVNIGSHIYEIYDDNDKFEDVVKYLMLNIKDGAKYDKEEIRKDDNGETYIYEASYVFQLVNKYEDVIVGSVVKDSKVYVKKFIEDTGRLEKKAVDNNEVIQFCFDVRKEIVAFYTTFRFKHKEFNEVFSGLLNNLKPVNLTNPTNQGDIEESLLEDKYFFSTSIVKQGLNIANLKKEIKKIGTIESLKIEVIPPNANGHILKSMKEKGKQEIKLMKSGNVTHYSTAFSSTSPKGLNVDSKIIDDEFNKVEGLHEELTQEKVLGNGYIKVEAKSKKGRVYSTNEKELVKYKVEDEEISDTYSFMVTCKKKMLEVINAFI